MEETIVEERDENSKKHKALKTTGVILYALSFVALFVCMLIFSDGIPAGDILWVILLMAFGWGAFMAEIMCFITGKNYAILRMIKKVSTARVVLVTTHVLVSAFAFVAMLTLLLIL